MRRMRCFHSTTLALALVFGFALVAHAERLGGMSELMNGAFDAKSRDVRTQLAGRVLAEVNHLADLMQTPRPSDVAWVKEEEAEIKQLTNDEAKTSRGLQLIAAPEFQQVRVHEWLQAVRNSFRCVMDQSVGLKQEIYCWASAGFMLGDKSVFQDGVRVLAKAKRLPENPNAPNDGEKAYDYVFYYFNICSRGIQEYLILPYLKGELK